MESDLQAAEQYEKRKKQKSLAVAAVVGVLVVAAAVAAFLFMRPGDAWDPGQEAEYAKLQGAITELESKCDVFLGKFGPLAGTEAELMRKCRWRLSSALTALDGYRAEGDTAGRRTVLDQVGYIVDDARKDYAALTVARSQ